jgi:hypothetical protein
MTAATDTARRLALKRTGTWHSADQGVILRLATEGGMAQANRGGVCWEVCRRWVRHRVRGTWTAGDTVFQILSPIRAGTSTQLDEGALRELIAAHAARNQAGVDANYAIDDLTRHATQYRTYGGCFNSAQGLKSRDAVLKVLFETPGAYIHAIAVKDGGGHAIAFDTTTAPYAFMDPNSGEGIFPTADTFKAFYKDYYGEVYKALYAKGDRELTRYTRAAQVAFA